ncbi:MAG: hypothetical protein EXR73_12080 [Myxococcales bacterium]|nr:hypothetical protein [Myxococcales bacterium]
MAEPLIPEKLLARIRAGRAAIVVGSSIGTLAGLPSWKKVLERLREELERRGGAGDKVAADDVAGLLKKGRIVAACSFLARSIGGEACERALVDLWKTPAALPEVLKALGRIPVRAVWTTHPGDLVERALASGTPDGWPAARVVTYEECDGLDPRKRHLLKLLGEVGRNYVLVPASVRRRLASATAYRALLADLYRDGALVFVGFRHGDPDLHAVLDRVLGTFDLPDVEHYFVGAGLSPVDIEDLREEHKLQVIALDGQGGDDKSAASLAAWLGALAEACTKEGIDLSSTKLGDDDVDGWIARLAEDGADFAAIAALAAIADGARSAKDHEKLVHVLLAGIEYETDPAVRATTLLELAKLHEDELGDLPGAFAMLTAALREQPSNEQLVVEAERLAYATDGWSELVADLAAIVPAIEDRAVAAGHWVRLGRWYTEHLRHDDYAIASLHQGLKCDPRRTDARELLVELYRKQQRWGELAEALVGYAEAETAPEKRAGAWIALGEVQETQLASTEKAIEAYEKASTGGERQSVALVALERLHRRLENWGPLAAVLDKSADLADATDPARAASLRKDLATIRSERLGDLEGATVRYEVALTTNDRDLDALKALERLYEKLGRTEDYLRVVERLAEVGPESERALTWRRLAAEVEDRPDGAERAIRYYGRLLATDPADAVRALDRLHRIVGNFPALALLHEGRATAATDPATRAESLLTVATIAAGELHDLPRALVACKAAVAAAPNRKDALEQLVGLLGKVSRHADAVPHLVHLGALTGEQDPAQSAKYLLEAGRVLAHEVHDHAAAEVQLAKVLELEPTNVAAMLVLVEVYRKRRDWDRAVKLSLDAEKLTQNRREKVKLLFGAALITEEFLDQKDAALDLYARVLAVDPEHAEAGDRAAARWVELGRFAEAEPVLEMLVRKADPEDHAERARRETLVGRAAERLEKPEKAQRHYRAALETKPDALDPALALAALHAARGEWTEAESRARDIIKRHAGALDAKRIAELWFEVARAAQARSELVVADEAVLEALRFEPKHRAALTLAVTLADARGDAQAGISRRRAALAGRPEAEQVTLLTEVGDLAAEKLHDPVKAIAAYREALAIAPSSSSLLHKALLLEYEREAWPAYVDLLERRAELETDPAGRATFHYAAAVAYRDNLKNYARALQHFAAALEARPNQPKASEAIERMLEEQADWKGLVRHYRARLKQLGEDAPEEQQARLWARLGDVALDRLGDRVAAMTAFEAATELDPADQPRRDQLRALYLEAGPDQHDKAILAVQEVLRLEPHRVELYQQLSRLYRETRQTDKAYCLAAALVFVGKADEDETARFDAHRGRRFPLARRRITEELWQSAVVHPREDRALAAMFAALAAPFAALSGQPRSAFGLGEPVPTDLAEDDQLGARMVRYATQTLGLDPAPDVFFQARSREPFRAANVIEEGSLLPAVLLGEPYLGPSPGGPRERAIAFDVAKRLVFFRPERFVYYSLPTLPRLRATVDATLRLCGATNGQASPETAQVLASLKATVPDAVRDQCAAFATSLASLDADVLVREWSTATDLTATRVGLLLAGDLHVAAHCVATEKDVPSTLLPKARLQELLAYSVSESCFEVRKHLGVDVG